ncbi:MbtH family NRPS accessory protein [Streptomyces sp. NPDC091215]|uniref:MbtH family NRPS accessory protein n=1 Tax=Streptomyces sp. NPDC091215 TaxID=3155192 RepID=UPI00343A61A0
MAANPFEEENGFLLVLVNEVGQHSLWPAFADLSDGWTVIELSKAARRDSIAQGVPCVTSPVRAAFHFGHPGRMFQWR